MKILIFSDSHGYATNMIDAIEKEKPDCTIHLGDGERDLETVGWVYPNLTVYNVRGNCDGWSATPTELVLTLGGRRIYCVHGNLHRVKRYELSPELAAAAHEAEAGLVLYGHTHNALHLGEDGLEVLNPGTIKNDPKASYAVLTMDDRGSEVEIKSI